MENIFGLSNLKIHYILFWIFLIIIASKFIVVMLPLFALIAAVGMLILISCTFKPEIGILAIVVIISSIIFEEALPLIPIGIGSLHIPDVFLLFLLFMMSFKLITDTDFRFVKTSLDKALILFYCLGLISAGIATIYFNVDINVVMRQFRCLTYYLTFFVVTNFIREKSEIKLIIKGLLVIAAVVAVTMIIQAVIGQSFILVPGRVEMATTLGVRYQSFRILPPGQTLIYVMFITIVCHLVIINKPFFKKSWTFILFIIIGIAICLTYNRSYWIAIIFSSNILILITATKVKIRIMAISFIVLILISLSLPLLLRTSPKMQKTLISFSDRFTSIFKAKQIYYGGSISWRKMENRIAIEKIKKYPIFGIGLANAYRVARGNYDSLTGYAHNGYIWITVQMGLLGLFAFLWFYTKFLIRGFVRWKSVKDQFLRSSILGFTLSGLGILLVNIVNPIFMQWFSIVVIAVMIGLTEAIIGVSEREAKKLGE